MSEEKNPLTVKRYQNGVVVEMLGDKSISIASAETQDDIFLLILRRKLTEDEVEEYVKNPPPRNCGYIVDNGVMEHVVKLTPIGLQALHMGLDRCYNDGVVKPAYGRYAPMKHFVLEGEEGVTAQVLKSIADHA